MITQRSFAIIIEWIIGALFILICAGCTVIKPDSTITITPGLSPTSTYNSGTPETTKQYDSVTPSFPFQTSTYSEETKTPMAMGTRTVLSTSMPELTSTATLLSLPQETRPLNPADFVVINRSNIGRIKPVSSYAPSKVITSNYGTSFAVSPDGHMVAFQNGKQVDFFDLWAGKITYSFLVSKDDTSNDSIPWIMAFSPGGKELAGLTEQAPLLWSVFDGKVIWEGKNDQCDPTQAWSCNPGTYTSLSFTPDGANILTTGAAYGGNIRLWSAKTGKLIKTIKAGNQLDSVFTPDGNLLITTSREDGSINFWNTTTWTQSGSLNIVEAEGVVLSPNGELLADLLHGDDGISLYRVKDWKLLGQIREKEPITYNPMSIIAGPVLNSDGGIIAFIFEDTSNGDTIPTISFWDSLNQKEILNFVPSFQNPVNGLAFSRDGKLLIVSSSNGTVQFYGVMKK